MSIHPKSSFLTLNRVKFKQPISLWRSYQGEFYRCTPENLYQTQLDLMVNLDLQLDVFKSDLKSRLGDRLPDGYYYLTYLTWDGDYLATDNFQVFINKLIELDLIEIH